MSEFLFLAKTQHTHLLPKILVSYWTQSLLYVLTILTCLVFSTLFHCSTVWSGTFKQNIHKLHLLKNFTAYLLTNTRKFNHILPVLWELGWCSIKHHLSVQMSHSCTKKYSELTMHPPTQIATCTSIKEFIVIISD